LHEIGISDNIKELIYATKVRMEPGSEKLKNAMRKAKID